MFKVSHFDPKTLRWWWTQKDKIDMDPPYQRHGRLWSTTDKAFLIDSIINEYDVPKIYVADFTFGISELNKKRLSFAIIDGKQRLEAIFDFYDGHLFLDKDFICESDPSLKLGSLGYSDLRKNYPHIADIFDNFPLSVMRVITNEEEKINELFVRLNRSKPLTGAEIRNAMSGPLPQLIRVVTNHDFFKSCIRFPIHRGQDKNAAAKLLLFEFKQQPVETKKKNLDNFVDMAKKDKDMVELASRRVIDTLERMSEIFLPKDPLLAYAGIFPVYFWFIRQQSVKHDINIREFLIDFDRKRTVNRKLNKPDKEYIDFDLCNRNANDEKSYVVRTKILNQKFIDYKKNKHIQ